MRIKYVIIICAILNSIVTSAQNWLQGAGGNSQDEALAITTDSQNNIITTGYFSQSARFDNFIIGSAGMGDVFIAKQNTNGDYLWVTKAGGLYSDRSYSVTTDANNNIYITGVFKGTSVFGTTTLTSINNSQDIFVAKLDASGNFIWAVSFGGDDTEIANDIDVDASGNIIVGGQYKGNALFGSFSLSSNVYNSSMGTLSGLPSYDGFLLNLNNNGIPVWVKNFAAEYDDRVMKCEYDVAGNIFISGQFSDTLNTGTIYNNNAYNAAFILKTDAAGNDIWFRRLLSPQIMIYDIKTNGTDIFLTGDAKGNININTSPVTVISANAGDFNIYVIKMNANGSVVWSATQHSENTLSSRAISITSNNEICIGGYFNCSFTEFSSLYQPALFNSVGFKDVFLIQYDAQGNRIWERNYGGIGEDWIWGLEISSSDQPVLAGSYNGSFSMPYGNNFLLHDSAEDLAGIHGNTGITVCSNSNYGKYAYAKSIGNKDILSAKPVDISLPHYDYYLRLNSTCNLDTLMPQLFPLSDTVQACDSTKLWIRTNTTVDYLSAPDWEFLWSNNSTNDTISVQTTGWYFVEYGFKDDCRRFKDSVYVEIYSSPFTPQITSSNFNILQAIPHDGCYNKLAKMINDTAYLHAGNIYPGYDFYWTDPSGNIIVDTNIMAIDFGVYTLEVTSPNGMCSRSQCVKVYDYLAASGSCNNLNALVPMLVLTDSNYNDTDTVIVCKDDFFGVEFFDSIDFVNNMPTYLNTFIEWTIIQGGFSVSFPNSAQYTFRSHHQEYRAFSSGNCVLQAEILHPVTHQPVLSVTRNFYLNVREAPVNNPVINGPTTFCPGDTVLLTVSGGDEYVWSGPGIVSVNAPINDSVQITMDGIYHLSSTTRDTVLDCPDQVGISYLISAPDAPAVMMSPSHGVICPNDSVLLTAVAGSNYEWYGPTGTVLSTSSSVWVTVPGFYYYTFTTPGGCSLLSDMAEVKEYSTPFLEADPGTNLCPGGSLTISVESNELSLVSWLSPLSGSSFSQTINTPGIYQASVSFCNIATVVDIEITMSVLNAQILYSGNDTICENEEIVLITDAAGANINWLPGNESGSVFVPVETGPYILELTDAGGCIDYDTLELNYFSLPDSPFVSDTMTCGADTLVLVASSANSVFWYDANENFLMENDTLTTYINNSSSDFWVYAFDGMCYSNASVLNVSLFPSAIQPLVYGDSLICNNDTLILFTDTITGFNYSWTGPNNFSDSSNIIMITPFTTLHEGTYSLVVYDSLCQSTMSDFVVSLGNSVLTSFVLNQTICEGDSLLLSEPISGDYVWQDGSTNDSLWIFSSGQYFYQITNENNCVSNSDTININVLPIPELNVSQDTSVCIGTNLILFADANGSLIYWEDVATGFAADGDSVYLENINSDYSILVFATDSLGCSSVADTVFVYTLPQEDAPIITSNDSVCLGYSLELYAVSSSQNIIWEGPDGFSENNDSVLINPVSNVHEGSWWVYSLNGNCHSDTSEIYVTVVPLEELEISQDLSICIGDTAELSVLLGSDFYWSNSSTQNSILVAPDTSQWYFAVIESYCGLVYDSVFVTVNDLPEVDLGPDQTILSGLGIHLEITSGETYNWWPIQGLTCSDCSSVFASPLEETEYFVTVIDSNGCVSSDSITIFVDNETTCFIPNSFTPNNDGLNDFFQPMVYGLENYRIRIFNRWGEIIFETTDANLGWNGMVKGQASPQGTYVYQVSGLDLNGEEKNWQGHLNLLR
jgi:gliding motility-associated-like protein